MRRTSGRAVGPGSPPAPRVFRTWAPAFVLTCLALAVSALGIAPAGAQEPPDTVPPRADTVGVAPDSAAVPDSLQAAPDSAAVPDSLQASPDTATAADSLQTSPDQTVPDSLQALPDSLAQVVDTAAVDFDTIPLPLMPSAVRGEALEWTNEIWEWDREALRGTRAMEMGELLSLVPGAVPLRGGDYGMPRSVSAFAAGAGRIRLFWDGFEMVPLEGGVVDLARVSLAGVERVRVERTLGELRVEVWSIEQSDPRPYTVIETGTGDLRTNQFRATFGHPRVLGGKLYVAIDRLDTQGTEAREPGTSAGFWASYTFEPSETWGIRAEFRRMSSQRDTIYLPGKVGRSDWVIRGRAELWQDVVADAFVGRSWIGKSSDDSLVAFAEPSRAQYGARLGVEKPAFWGSASARIQSGEGIPGSVLELRAGLRSPQAGGIAGALAREGWDGASATAVQARAWTRSLLGFSLFGSLESGKRGVPWVPAAPPLPTPPDTTAPPMDTTVTPPMDTLPPPEPREPRFTDRSTLRFGVRFQWRGLWLSGARLSVEADSLHPLGLPTDRAGLVVPGGTRKGFEVAGNLPLILRGLALRGNYQWWDEEPAMRYLPLQSWQAELAFERTLLQSGNLEILASVGAQGRDPMLLPLLSSESTPEEQVFEVSPWYQSWYARLQIRVMTFRIYVTAENLVRKPDNQDYLGRLFPIARIMYGVRWTLWN